MTSLILLFVCMVLLCIVPTVLYRCPFNFMMVFYKYMAALPNARKLYRKLLLILLLLFHLIYISAIPREYGIFVSTLAFAVFYRFMDVDRWLHCLNENRKLSWAFGITSVVVVFIPHMIPLAVTMAVILLASLFYPSQRIIQEFKDPDMLVRLKSNRRLLVTHYYDVSPEECHKK